MSSTILSNPYTAILQAIWGIIINVAQSTANTLGICQLNLFTKTSQHENNTIPDSGAANPLGLLHPEEWGCGVSNDDKHLHSVPEPSMIGVDPDGFVTTSREVTLKAIAGRLTGADWSLFYYLQMVDPNAECLSSPEQIGQTIGFSSRQVRRSATRLVELGLIVTPSWLQNKPSLQIEKGIRDRLHAQLGGLTEVITTAGRIDLLTSTEVVEVKAFKDWKAALGQILVYSAFYPEHQKRIHLFGTAAELSRLADIQAACIGFDVLVTGEVSNE